MKNILFIICLIVLNLKTFSQSKTSEKDALIFIKSFYTEYIKLSDSPNLKKIETLKQKYCSQKLLKSINDDLESGDLDYDVFVNAQDIDEKWLKTLSVNRELKSNIYSVSYFDNYQRKTIKIKLKIINKGGKYLIDNIL